MNLLSCSFYLVICNCWFQKTVVPATAFLLSQNGSAFEMTINRVKVVFAFFSLNYQSTMSFVKQLPPGLQVKG